MPYSTAQPDSRLSSFDTLAILFLFYANVRLIQALCLLGQHGAAILRRLLRIIGFRYAVCFPFTRECATNGRYYILRSLALAKINGNWAAASLGKKLKIPLVIRCFIRLTIRTT